MSDFVNIEDAKALKRMGLPLNMPIEHRQSARESTKPWCRLWDDPAKFCWRTLDYEKDPTERKLKIWTASLKKIDRAAKALLDHANKLKDRHEAAAPNSGATPSDREVALAMAAKLRAAS
jgi:hypothetical protein